MIDLGCPAHIIHNTARTALDMMFSTCSQKYLEYVHIFTVRVERLKGFCEFVGQEYHNILGHSNVHWMSMLPALERVLKMCHSNPFLFLKTNALLSCEQCSKIH